MTRKKILPIVFWALLILFFDLATKYWAKASLEEFGFRRINGILNLVLVQNPGVAFSLFSGSGENQGLFMTALSLISMLPLLYFFSRARPGDRTLLFSLGLILGGALGNIHDRLRYNAVVDFLDFHWLESHWPAFNLADAAICLGVGLLLILTLVDKRK